MRSSKWSAQGNVYLLVEDERVKADLARELSAEQETDGVLEVVAVQGVEADILIWNPDGSRAELSGNGTRIAARWRALNTGANQVRIRVGPRVVEATIRGGFEVETDIGEVEVGEPETIDVAGETLELT